MLLYAQLIILVILGVLDVWLGIVKGAYLTIWWWDIPMHFLGGVWVGLFAAWLLRRSKMAKKINLILACALCAFIVGVLWEIFEYHFGIGGSAFMGYWPDTIKDVVMDTVGGTVVGSAIYLERDLWRK